VSTGPKHFTDLERSILGWIADRARSDEPDLAALIDRVGFHFREAWEGGAVVEFAAVNAPTAGDLRSIDGPEVVSEELPEGAITRLWLLDDQPDHLEIISVLEDRAVQVDEFELRTPSADARAFAAAYDPQPPKQGLIGNILWVIITIAGVVLGVWGAIVKLNQ
jgi:hypothetical protein